MKPFVPVTSPIMRVHFIVVLIAVCSGLMATSLVKPQEIPQNASDIIGSESRPWQDSNDPIPVMAYYYIWFDTASWNRAKIDYPLLGRYSSDDRAVMQQHVRWAKEAGIDGFIVSWKSTNTLDRRLELLMDVSAQEDFKLWIIYQGLDFYRNPLSVDRIVNDLAFFLKRYANHPAFDMYDLPVVIWSGTWMFSNQDIKDVANAYEDWFYLLATERNVKDYQKLAEFVDGNAYYWSSVNPDTFPFYEEKLSELGKAVHDHGGLWVAPAAPGFDARLVGGSSIVSRQGHQTLLTEMNAALASSPDAIGLISWNEFSENTHIEPSQNYGTTALDALAQRHITVAPHILDFDSSAPGITQRNDLYGVYILAGFFVFIGVSLGLIILRTRRLNKKPDSPLSNIQN
jgi:Glycosyl hydrolase family 99